MRHLLSVLLSLFILCACASPTRPSPQPQTTSPSAAGAPLSAPSATQPPTPSAPATSVTQATSLYSGPDTAGYETLMTIDAGQPVTALGSFGDFIQVEVQKEPGARGFLRKDALANLPANLADLSLAEIPWESLDVLNSFIDPHTNLGNNQVSIKNDTDGYVDPIGSGILLDAPFRLRAKLEPQDAAYGQVKLMGTPSPTQGEWWQGITRLDVSIETGGFLLGIRDGSTEGTNASISVPAPSGRPFTLLFHDPQGKTFSLLDENGQELILVTVTALPGVNLPNGLFPARQLYLGASSAPHSTLVITDISFEKAPSGKMLVSDLPEPGLKDLAQKHHISVGTAYTLYDFRDARFYKIVEKNFNVLSIGDFTSKEFWRGPDQYDFSWLDQEVNFAIEHGYKVRAMHLVWGTSAEEDVIPDWLRNGKYTRDEYIQFLKQYIQTVVTRYKGKVTEWSIANEAIQRSYWPGADFWNDKIGPDYIEMSFRLAHEIDPDAVLIFNGDNNESPRDEQTRQNVEKTYQMVKTLKAKGVTIDVVGMQMHFNLEGNSLIRPTKDDVIATMRRFGELGVKVYITEMDLDVHNVPGTQAEKWEYQAAWYKDMVEACLESGVCASFSTWGVSDANSWITCADAWCRNIPDGDPLMFDKDYFPKPAYFAVQAALGK